MKARTFLIPILLALFSHHRAVLSEPGPVPAASRPKTVMVKVWASSQEDGYEAYRALDDDPRTMWHTQWIGDTPAPPHEIVVDLGRDYPLGGLVYVPRRDGCENGTIEDFEVYVSTDLKDFGRPVVQGRFGNEAERNEVRFAEPTRGRYVKVRALSEVNERPWASVASLEFEAPGVRFLASADGDHSLVPLPSQVAAADTELSIQYRALRRDLAKRGQFQKVAAQTYHASALVLESDRDPLDIVLRRTAALLADLKTVSEAPGLSGAEEALARWRQAGEAVPVEDADARFALFEKVCAVRREIALANPLLDFEQILFIKRHRSEFNHMCDQYYGINAKPGGGIYILSKPFSGQPEVRDVLADSAVERGRLQGRKLQGGSFLSPDLSYDGRRILFAYVECEGDTAHRFHTDPSRGHWDEGRSYHLFKVNVDGTGLEQLTDGTWNDFDPCWLPNGRVAFITERRGGYLRCGRVCPTYTLYDMAEDGRDIRCLSPHETNEWQPSVTDDGTIIYTRWDYVDRHGCTAHLPWVTTLDGRNARAVHGNFAPRELRPDMELDVRAIPDSPRYVATAAPHHGQAYGSLVMFDPRTQDDDAMAPVKRLTPEVAFPESQGGAQVYGTPWPLSEKYYLCVYDATLQPGVGQQGGDYKRGDYGIYLVDVFGNKELLYRDPEIASLSPIPLRARPMPPSVPPHSRPESPPEPSEGTLTVLNVYESLKPWPEGTRITALRVYQILPMSVPSGAPPHEIGLRLPTGMDSVILARYVLGTVPVEADGSAHFAVPAGKELFFQALDENGLAVQSMRSATYVQPGENLMCQGCHEPAHRAPSLPRTLPLALRRAPSRLQPDVDGTNPFSYPRLVQPVLDRHCVACHAEHPGQAPRLDAEVVRDGNKIWFASYFSLAPEYGFWQYGDRHRTTPGQFGARASKLYALLQKGHYHVDLPQEDLHRLLLWLDSCSVFYGVYEKEGGEAQLRGEVVYPTLE